MYRTLACATLALAFCASSAADEVIMNDGSRLTGKIGTISGGTMKFTSDSLGDMTLDMTKVKSYTTDEPARVKIKHDGFVDGKITAGDPAQVQIEGQEGPISLDNVRLINPPPEKWTGSIVANGYLARGNTHEMGLGVSADATLRRDNERNDDRFSVTGAYNFSKQRDPATGNDLTSADNWFAAVKYDKFFTEQWYGYATMRYDHDRLAFLDYRLSPGVGVGYQWVETPTFNLFTEAGVSYVYEEYSNDGNQDRVALRLAYHIDKSLNEKVKVFHNLEWLPAFDNPADYNLNVDAGVRATLVKNFFTEFKAVYQRDSTPAPGAEKDDIRLLLGVGWSF